MPLSPCIQYFCVQSNLCIRCCHVSNRSVSNWFGVQFYRVQSVQCLILLCPNGFVSNPTMSNQFGVQSWRVQSVRCPILLFPIGLTAQASVLCAQSACVQWVQSPDQIIRVSNIPVSNWFCVQCCCVQLDLCIQWCSYFFNRNVSNRFCIQSWCVELVRCPIILCPIGPVSSIFVSNNLCPIGRCSTGMCAAGHHSLLGTRYFIRHAMGDSGDTRSLRSRTDVTVNCNCENERWGKAWR